MQPEDYAIDMLRRTADSVDQVYDAIFGNGGVGLAEQVRDNRAELARIRERLDRLEAHPSEVEQLAAWKVRWEVVGAVVAVAMSAMAYIEMILGG